MACSRFSTGPPLVPPLAPYREAENSSRQKYEKNQENTMLWRKVYRQQQLEILEHVQQRIEARLTEKELHQARELANSWKKRKFLNSIMSEGLYLGEYHIFNALILSTMLLLGYLSILTITANPREPKNQLISLILISETLILLFSFSLLLFIESREALRLAMSCLEWRQQ